MVLAACALAWVVGRVLSDRYAWSQPISWVPTPVLLGPVWMGCGVWLWRARGRRVRAKRRGASGRARSKGLVSGLGALGLFTLVSAGHLAFVELGLHRAVLGGRDARAAHAQGNEIEGAPPLRLIFWNQAGHEAGDVAEVFLAHDPTLFVLANRHSGTKTSGLAQAFIDTGKAHAAVGWPFDLFSRVPIRRWASTSLGLGGLSRTRDGSPRPDPGWAAWYELETSAGLLVIWVVDLPSDPDLPRFPLARAAGEALSTWQGSVRVIDAEGQHRERADRAGFPPPDLIVGDFNIPRSSASLSEFLRAAGAGEMRNAFDLAGSGWQRTWPRERPIWAIDQCFVGSRLRVRTTTTLDPGVGSHRAIVIECELD